MGLGPAACQYCKVIGVYVSPPVPIIRTEHTRTLYKTTSWVCPICGNTDLQDNTGLDLTKIKEYEANETFLRFIANKIKSDD